MGDSRPAPMGVKVLQCFPWYRRCKERGKSRQSLQEEAPSVEVQPRLSSTASWGSEGEGGGSLGGAQVYFSHKARLSFRHQMDSNINAVDATY
ncbi:hypothetical protein AAFF_G00121930 [Aldrovandia affinis]|uniref:Uncharacterized protein n=1 Tax=Aldrovandia affinis TaxID=143900 RepID=A0AAD7RSI4_9TELE|nr:hypothetical protein AAFF_G00121930 [Aldrovandia affinis]